MKQFSLPTRMRRLRQKPSTQSLIRETRLHPHDFVYPLFIKESISEKQAIDSMPGVYQLPLSALSEEVKQLQALNIQAVILFGIPKDKDETGSSALKEDGIIQQSVQMIKEIAPELTVITDLCFCEYTAHGHCGALHPHHTVDNDKTLSLLQAQALSHAKAGADIIAPSGMMDGMVQAIRSALDENHYHDKSILSYAAKYSSAFYGPFREAAEGAPQFGNRAHYQMDFANGREALREVQLDVLEGADLLMVKPAMNYLDVIYRIKENYPDIPLSAYQVSGEYALIKHGAKLGLIDETQGMIESLTAIKRAGSDFIITYFAKEMNQLLLK